MKTLILFLILITTAHAQTSEGVNTLQQAGWFNSHHRAYQWHKVEQPRYDAQSQQMQLYREAAIESLRMNHGFQRNPSQNTVRCFNTAYGVICQ
jgi:hypothetical protein